MTAVPDAHRDAEPAPAVAPFSVLMSTYAGERAAHLAAALDSLDAQTLPAAEVVLVLDGPVDGEQEHVIAAFAARHRSPVHVVRSPRAQGLPGALNLGLGAVTQPWVARMDSDDVCAAERFAVQAAALAADPGIDLLASWHDEFADDPGRVERVKRTPPDHEAIVRAMRWRGIISHPSIVVRRAMLEAVGGYRDVRFLEDHDLYWRMVTAGARLGCVQRSLVSVRTAHGQIGRRGGWRYVRSEWRYRYDCWRRGNLSLPVFLASASAYTVFRLVPVPVRRALYRFVRARPSPPHLPHPPLPARRGRGWRLPWRQP